MSQGEDWDARISRIEHLKHWDCWCCLQEQEFHIVSTPETRRNRDGLGYDASQLILKGLMPKNC